MYSTSGTDNIDRWMLLTMKINDTPKYHFPTYQIPGKQKACIKWANFVNNIFVKFHITNNQVKTLIWHHMIAFQIISLLLRLLHNIIIVKCSSRGIVMAIWTPESGASCMHFICLPHCINQH